MTIALGFLAKDCMVLAADSEISYAHDYKTSGRKVRLNSDAGILGGTGTGDVGYIDALYYEIEQAFLSQPNASTRQLKELFGQR